MIVSSSTVFVDIFEVKQSRGGCAVGHPPAAQLQYELVLRCFESLWLRKLSFDHPKSVVGLRFH